MLHFFSLIADGQCNVNLAPDNQDLLSLKGLFLKVQEVDARRLGEFIKSLVVFYHMNYGLNYV